VREYDGTIDTSGNSTLLDGRSVEHNTMCGVQACDTLSLPETAVTYGAAVLYDTNQSFPLCGGITTLEFPWSVGVTGVGLDHEGGRVVR
jgi:hypothetical protein